MKNNTGETDIHKLIAHMEPILQEGTYVFTTVTDTDNIPREITIAEIKEKEGITLILPKLDADRLGLTYNYIAAWISLNIHSSLDAVGLTAAFSTALASHGVSCNVIAGYYHDHIFVNEKNVDIAMQILMKMSK